MSDGSDDGEFTLSEKMNFRRSNVTMGAIKKRLHKIEGGIETLRVGIESDGGIDEVEAETLEAVSKVMELRLELKTSVERLQNTINEVEQRMERLERITKKLNNAVKEL